MRKLVTALTALALAAGCGGKDAAGKAEGAQPLEGDAAMIAAAQKASDALGGCVRPADAPGESKVISLENGAIVVMLACSQGAYSFTNRLFAARMGEPLELLPLPDYDTKGWFASDQASMPELDAGSGVLTTLRKSAGHGGCGSEGRYKWDGVRFALEEMRWRDCGDPSLGPPPFPVVWPIPPAADAADLSKTAPAP